MKEGLKVHTFLVFPSYTYIALPSLSLFAECMAILATYYIAIAIALSSFIILLDRPFLDWYTTTTTALFLSPSAKTAVAAVAEAATRTGKRHSKGRSAGLVRFSVSLFESL